MASCREPPITTMASGLWVWAPIPFESGRPHPLIGCAVGMVDDEQGNALFETGDLEPLMSKAASAFLRLQDAILALSGLTEESRKELEKNLLSAPSDGPDSD